MYPYSRRDKPRTAVLALGDASVVVALVTAGAVHHGSAAPVRLASVALPFVFGWFVVAPLAGAYAEYPSRRNEAFATLGAWGVAALVGLALRSTSLFVGRSPPSFGFVMVVVGGFAVVSWRLVVARLVVYAVRSTR